jgi:predicted amidophosphoribosyltransferase
VASRLVDEPFGVAACVTIWPVRAFACPVCNAFAPFESDACADCGTALGFHLATKSLLPIADGVVALWLTR